MFICDVFDLFFFEFSKDQICDLFLVLTLLDDVIEAFDLFP